MGISSLDHVEVSPDERTVRRCERNLRILMGMSVRGEDGKEV